MIGLKFPTVETMKKKKKRGLLVSEIRPELGPTVYVAESAQIRRGVKLGPWCQILNGAWIGAGSQIGHNVFIDRNVYIGRRCRIGGNVTIPRGVTLADQVFVGGGTFFCNDKHPTAKKTAREFREWFPRSRTFVMRGVSIGANCTILPGVTLGENCVIGAGSVVTHDIPSNTVVHGTAAFSRNGPYV